LSASESPRVVIFRDFQTIYHRARDAFCVRDAAAREGQVDPLALGQCDVGILFSSDTDLVPALEAVLALLPGDPPACEVAARVAPGMRPRSLSVRGPHIRRHLLSEAGFRSVADLTDYTRAR
jgi:hypothetical protein